MNDFLIIVIGLSAGGVKPVIELIGQMPHDLQAAVFVVLHQSHRSNLHVLLEARTRLATQLARDLEPIRAGHVYVCPPDEYLSVENGIIRVEHSPKESQFRPSVNALFHSAARVYGRRVIGVILSGMMSDGSAGLWQIKKHGGVTIVQDPDEAEYPSMPQSAIDSVAIDHVLPVARIGPKLAELVAAHAVTAAVTPRILIVEDESVVATNLLQSLAEMGYDVIDWVPTGKRASTSPSTSVRTSF